MSMESITFDYYILICVTLIVLYWSYSYKLMNLPPGPIGVPILGYLPFVNHQTIHMDCIELAKKYNSNVICFKLGFDNVVVLNDYESIVETLSKEEVQDRPYHFFLNLFTTSGNIGTWNGKLWKNQRGFTLRSLRNLGFGKSKFEMKIHEEINYMTEKIDQKIVTDKSKPLLIKKFLGPAVSNTISLMVTGIRYDYDHEIRKTLDSIFLADSEVSFFSWISYFPEIVKFFFLLPTTESKKINFMISYLQKYFIGLINDRKIKFDAMSDAELYEEKDNFIDVYLKHIRELELKSFSEDNDFFNLTNLEGCGHVIFGAGSGTTKDLIEWFLALMATHQDVQQGMSDEIARVVGASGAVSINNRSELPITEAIINEALRISSLVPINLPRAASKDIKINGYNIPKGTIIKANLYAVHMDAKYWERPESFNYKRFLSGDGTKFVKSDHLMAFGYGRRSCPGESMAFMEIMLFAVTLIQKYKVTKENDISITPHMSGPFRVPHTNLKLIFHQR